jgi:small subunit ribosomal protein S2
MKPFIHGGRNGIYIIDLQKTARKFREAVAFVQDAAARGGSVLFVGTKRQAQEAIVEEARRCNMFYVDQRWLGGTLTNFTTIRRSINRLKELDELVESEDAAKLTKKELSRVEKERGKLQKSLSGIKDMEKLPQVVFVVDPRRERIAIAEANKLNIPVVAIVDTNCDPDPIDYPIPGNDDALRSIKLFSSRIADAVIEGAAAWKEAKKQAPAEREQRVASAPRSVADRVRARTARREALRAQAVRTPEPVAAGAGEAPAEAPSGSGDKDGGAE